MAGCRWLDIDDDVDDRDESTHFPPGRTHARTNEKVILFFWGGGDPKMNLPPGRRAGWVGKEGPGRKGGVVCISTARQPAL